MSHTRAILTRNQRIGIAAIFIILSLIFAGLHWLPAPEQTPTESEVDTLKKVIIHHKKSHYDSLRAIRTARYDSLRIVRRDSLHQLYKAHRDSAHRADSLWWDSVYHTTPHVRKCDTILSLNTADTNELKLIRGIGSSMARRIVRYRDELGGFVSVRQLQDEAMYQDAYGHSIKNKYCLHDSILDAFTIRNDSIRRISVNHASIERMQAHPYISYTLAKEIYTLRRKRITLNNIDDLRALPQATDSLLKHLAPYLSFEK